MITGQGGGTGTGIRHQDLRVEMTMMNKVSVTWIIIWG